MRAEKVFGYIGLGFFFLFPLVSLLQLRDTDDAWRQAARRVRPSVVSLHHVLGSGATGEAEAFACGVVLAGEPLRVAVAGRTDGQRSTSPTASGWLAWEPAYEDPAGDFSILQAAPGQGGEPVLRSAGTNEEPEKVAALRAATTGTLEDSKAMADGVSAALVGAEHLTGAPIWVGILTPKQAGGSHSTLHAGVLRPVREAAGVSAANALADDPPGIDPALAGAPFVDRHGTVLALYMGRRDQGAEALPIAVVSQALAALDRRAEH